MLYCDFRHPSPWRRPNPVRICKAHARLESRFELVVGKPADQHWCMVSIMSVVHDGKQCRYDELDFGLSQKSYSLSINAVQMLATKRPVFFKDSSTCLARRTIDPPGGATGSADGLLTKAAVIGIRTHLRSSCLTLLRNFLSMTSGCWEILTTALTQSEMKAQADRALQAWRSSRT